jgi:hypothetical protein
MEACWSDDLTIRVIKWEYGGTAVGDKRWRKLIGCHRERC